MKTKTSDKWRAGTEEKTAKADQQERADRRHVKNADWSGDVYDNKGEVEMQIDRSGDFYENKDVIRQIRLSKYIIES